MNDEQRKNMRRKEILIILAAIGLIATIFMPTIIKHYPELFSFLK